MIDHAKKLTTKLLVIVNTAIAIAAFYFFLVPFGILVKDLQDPGLSKGELPSFTYRWHRNISEDFGMWAKQRVASKKALELYTGDISGTEWPMFSAVYFLWATEVLQEQWEKGAKKTESPVIYSKPAIEAAVALVVDPNNAKWVKDHWGDDYLNNENIFYRMLLISGLTSYQKLLGDEQYKSLLVEQVTSLSGELNDSPFGLLDDYPGQCYPVDVLPAISSIQRAGQLLGIDYSSFVKRSIRAFEGSRLDKLNDLPAYIANSKTGNGYGPARGVGVSYMLIWAPELWSDTSRKWYGQYEAHFWEEGTFVTGFREFQRGVFDTNFYFDVDSGPVVGGIGVAASAFGLGAARVNGRFDHAYPLGAEALVASWPLWDGTLLVPRMLSNLSDAPYLGETALLFNMTRMPLVVEKFRGNKRLPLIVYLGLFVYLLLGLVLIVPSTVYNVRFLKRLQS